MRELGDLQQTKDPAGVHAQFLDLHLCQILGNTGIEGPVLAFDDGHEENVTQIGCAGSLHMGMAETDDDVVRVVVARAVIPSGVIAAAVPTPLRRPSGIGTDLHQPEGSDGACEHVTAPASTNLRLDAGEALAESGSSGFCRGSSNPDDNTIMMAPGHEIGFGLVTNATIDQQVDARDRENDLAPVIKRHPELLGIGLDQSSSITVHGDTLTCNGPRRAAIWDGKDHDGKAYYYLRAGDTLNLVTHVATLVPNAAGTRKDNPAKLPLPVLASYAGIYEFRQGANMVITLEDGQLVSQLGQQPKVPLFAESEGKFAAKVVEAEIDFVKDADGKVTSLELHQNGREVTMNRLDDAAAKARRGRSCGQRSDRGKTVYGPGCRSWERCRDPPGHCGLARRNAALRSDEPGTCRRDPPAASRTQDHVCQLRRGEVGDLYRGCAERGRHLQS